MQKCTKSYLLNMSPVEQAFVKEMAWRRREKVSEYLRYLIHTEMKNKPEILEAVVDNLK